MSDNYLKFYAKCLELCGHNIPIFANEKEFDNYLRYYDFIGPCTFYYSIKKNERRWIIIISSIFLAVLLGFVVLTILANNNVFGIGEWMSKEID